MSAIYTLPALSAAIPEQNMAALIAGPPSPEKPGSAVPAYMLIMPAVFTLLMMLACEIYRLPAPSTAVLRGLMVALVAGPPLPASPLVPPPAMVLMVPEALTLRMRWLPPSTISRLPALSTATFRVWPRPLICALAAGPPSPEKPGVPVPATVVRSEERRVGKEGRSRW